MMIKTILKNKGDTVFTIGVFESVRDAMAMMVEHKIAALVLTNGAKVVRTGIRARYPEGHFNRRCLNSQCASRTYRYRSARYGIARRDDQAGHAADDV